MKKESQTTKLYNLLKDGRPVRTDEILRVVYGSEHDGLARPGARVNDLAAGNWPGKVKCEFIDRWGNPLGTKKNELKGWHDPDRPALFWYRMKVAAPITLPPAFKEQPQTQTQLL